MKHTTATIDAMTSVASAYARLSKVAGLTNTSKEGMLADLRALADTHRLELPDDMIHFDDGLSGAVRDRPEFVAWLEDAREGRASVLLGYHVDRLTREGLNVAAMILDVVEGKSPTTGRVVRSPVRLLDTHGLDSDDGDSFRLTFAIKAEIARAERARIAERNKAKDRRLREAGRWPGGPPPAGYESAPAPDGVGRVLVVVPAERDALREAAQMILGRKSASRVARWLTAHGPEPKRSKTKGWNRTTVIQALTGNAIMGVMSLDGAPMRTADGGLYAPFEPVLDLATVLKLREVLAPTPLERPRGGRLPARLLSRVIECASCGELLTVSATKHRDGSPRPVYRCWRRYSGVGECPAPVSITASMADEAAEAEYLAVADRLPVVERRVIVADDARLAEVVEQEGRALQALAQGATQARFETLARLQAERVELEAAPRETRVEWVTTGETQGDRWRRLADDVEGRREMLTDAWEACLLDPLAAGRRSVAAERMRVYWRHETDV